MSARVETPTPSWVGRIKLTGRPSDFFRDGPATHSASLVKRSPVLVLPGVHSWDPRFHKFLRTLSDEMTANCPAELDEDKGATMSGVHADFEKWKTVAGYSMNPLDFVVVDNDSYADELGLPRDFHSPRHRAIFDQLFRLVFKSWTPKSLKTPDYSTSGAPFWTSSARQKREHGVYLLKNREAVLRTFREKDTSALLRDFGVVNLMNAGRRDQVDSLGKERWSFPKEYALSGGRSGAPVLADKAVVLPDIGLVKGMSATRGRIYHGAPYASNLYPQVVATGTMHAMFVNYAFTFHHADIDRKAQDIPVTDDVLCTDITNYDRSMRKFLLRRMFTILREFWREDVVDWAERLMFCAYYTKPVDLSDTRGHLVGDPMKLIDQVFSGNRSGHAFTSLVAKLMRTFDDFATLDDVVHDVLERMEEYLRGEMPVKIWNNGDDGLQHGPRVVMAAYRAHRFAEKNPGYFKTEVEVGRGFSGKLIVRTPTGYRAYPRIHTTGEKLYIPERSIGGMFRSRWTIGVLSRFVPDERAMGIISPAHAKFVEIHSRVWRDTMLHEFGDFMHLIRSHHERIDVNMDALTPIDIEVLEAPEKLSYKYTDNDVSPHVLSMLFASNIQPDEFEGFETLFNGTIQ